MLFDHLLGARKHGRRNVETERLRNFEIHHKLVLGWSLHRHISGLLTLEYAIDVSRCAPVLVDEIWSIGDQAAASDKVPVGVDRRQAASVVTRLR